MNSLDSLPHNTPILNRKIKERNAASVRQKLSGGARRFLLSAMVFAGCGSSDIKPVDIYPEDMCAFCRMAISDEAFAAEIISLDREVYKFDDIGCMEEFAGKKDGLQILARYVKDYETKLWLPYEQSTIVRTGIKTPMGSGRIAFADSLKANAFAESHPAKPKRMRCCQGDHDAH